MLTRLCAVGIAAAATLAVALAGPAMAKSGLFISSAVEGPGDTVTLPLHHGTSHGSPVAFVVLDASSGAAADRLGVNRAQKLANAGAAAMDVDATLADVVRGTVRFPATVDFTPDRAVEAGPAAFPPALAQPGAVGEDGYSPLIRLRDGTVLNAPQIANTTGQADKVAGALRPGDATVTYRETNGFQGDRAVRYVSTDASDPVAAALEDATLAPRLNLAPAPGGDGTDSARASLAAFTNGALAPSGERQGLNSAIHDGLDPLNVLRWNPSQGRYSPLWDVHLAAWAPGVAPTVQRDWNTIEGLVDHGLITGFPSGAFGPAGFIVDCPIVFRAG
jgi:hypothetical protein